MVGGTIWTANLKACNMVLTNTRYREHIMKCTYCVKARTSDTNRFSKRLFDWGLRHSSFRQGNSEDGNTSLQSSSVWYSTKRFATKRNTEFQASL